MLNQCSWTNDWWKTIAHTEWSKGGWMCRHRLQQWGSNWSILRVSDTDCEPSFCNCNISNRPILLFAKPDDINTGIIMFRYCTGKVGHDHLSSQEQIFTSRIFDSNSLEEVVAHWHSHRQCRGETKRRQGKDCRDGRMGGCVVRHVSAGEASAMSVICHTNNSKASGLYTTSPPLVPIAFATASVITIFPANPNPLDLVQLSKSYNSYHVPSSWPFAHGTSKHSTQRLRSVPWKVFQCRTRVRMGAGVFHLKLRPPPSCKKPPTVISAAHSSNSWDTVQQSKHIIAWIIFTYEYFMGKGLE